MPIPSASVTIRDGALGIVSTGGVNTVALIGTCSGGTDNEVVSFGDLQALKDALGTGPLVECAAHILSAPGVSSVICVKAPSTTSGTSSAVTKTGTGTGTMTVSGSPLDACSVVVQILADGTNIAAGTASFRYSIDGGNTYSVEVAMPTGGTYAVAGTGLTLTFVNGASGTSFIAGDTHAFTTTAPAYTLANANTALDALLADTSTYFKVHLVGPAASVSDAAALAAALDVKLTAAADTYRFLYGTVECPADTDANIKSGFASFSSARVEVVVGFETVVSALTGLRIERSVAWSSSSRAAAISPGTHFGQVSNDDGQGGPLSGVVAIARDERVTPGLDEARFTTARTHIRRPGFFITRGRLMAPPGSDFQQIQYRRVMDVAANQSALDAQEYIAKSVLVDPVTGFIQEGEARAIENTLSGKLRAVLVQTDDVSAVSAVVVRTDNLISTGKLRVKVRVTPKGYTEFIEEELGFTNPALAAAA